MMLSKAAPTSHHHHELNACLNRFCGVGVGLVDEAVAAVGDVLGTLCAPLDMVVFVLEANELCALDGASASEAFDAIITFVVIVVSTVFDNSVRGMPRCGPASWLAV